MQILWDEFAMPSLMYGIQPCPISRKGITNLDLIQSKMVNSANNGNTSGFKPIWFHVYKSTMKFYFKVMNSDECEVIVNLKRELMKLKVASPFIARVNYILKQLKCRCEEYTKQKLEEYMLETVNAELKSLETTMFLVPYVNKLCKSEPGLPRHLGLNGKERKNLL